MKAQKQNFKYLFLILFGIMITKTKAQVTCSTANPKPVAGVQDGTTTFGDPLSINDGVATPDNGVGMNKTSDYMVLDLGMVYSAGTIIKLDIWGNGTDQRVVRTSDCASGVYQAVPPSINTQDNNVGVATLDSYEYELKSDTEYIQVDMVLRAGGRTEFVEATVINECFDVGGQSLVPVNDYWPAYLGDFNNSGIASFGHINALNSGNFTPALRQNSFGGVFLTSDSGTSYDFIMMQASQNYISLADDHTRFNNPIRFNQQPDGTNSMSRSVEIGTPSAYSGIVFDGTHKRFDMKNMFTHNSDTYFFLGYIGASANGIRIHRDKNTVSMDNLLVGSHSTANVIDGAVAHFDGRVYISEDDSRYSGDNDSEQNMLDLYNHANPIIQERYKEYLLWIDGKGAVASDLALTDTSEWVADYVFKDDYELPSLDFVKKHIEEKGHLHTMKSAEEYMKYGFSVKEITHNYLVTLEELTLHTINQEEEIKKLNEKLEKLMQVVEELTKK